MKAGRLAVAVAIVIAAIIATGLVLMLDNSHGSESYYKYSWIAQDIGFGLVDSAKEAKYMVENGIIEMSFKVGGTSIENPYDPDRLEHVKAEYPAP